MRALERPAEAAEAVAEVAREHDVVIAHGGEPLGGHLGRAVRDAIGTTEVLTVLVQVVCDPGDPGDPAPARPATPVGPVYTFDQAARAALANGWTVAPDGMGFRRVMPSPEPLAILEAERVRALADEGVLVICAGAGGLGSDMAVDVDRTAALLGEAVDADLLVLLADGDDPRTATGRAVAAESAGPKLEAARRFVEATGRPAAVGALGDAAAIVHGSAGTRVSPELAFAHDGAGHRD